MEVAKGKEAGQGRAQLEDKGKGKKAKIVPKTKGPEVDQGKEVAPKTKESKLVKPHAVAQEKKAASGKAANPPVSRPASKEDPPPTKAQPRIFLFFFFFSLQ